MKFIQLKLYDSCIDIPIFINITTITFVKEYPDSYIIRLISGESLEVEPSDELTNLIYNTDGEQ